MKNKNLSLVNFIQQLQEIFMLGLKCNPDDVIAEEVLRETLLIELKNAQAYICQENPILELIKNYHVESFDIGRIGFYTVDDMIEGNDYIAIGSEGAGDLIAIKKSTKQIVTIDGYFEELLVCCETPEQFLNNLIEIGKANVRHDSYKVKYELAKKLSLDSNGDISFYNEALSICKE